MLQERKSTLISNSPFSLAPVHPSWFECLQRGLAAMDPVYLKKMAQQSDWLPGPELIFNAFSLPLNKVNYILFGESPYPRKISAQGYAFWDAAVTDLWSAKGLNKKVNRATSLRNIIKMLIKAEGLCQKETISQEDIAQIDKTHLIQTNAELFHNLHLQGFLLLNACLVLQKGPKQLDARAWQPFLREILLCLLKDQPKVTFIFLGRIASTIEKLLDPYPIHAVYAEHPYNHSFINNQVMLDFFAPFHFLRPTKF